MKAQRATHRVGKMARLLETSRGGFYAWLARPESRGSLQNKDLVALIRGGPGESKVPLRSPFQDALFVFCNAQRPILKALYWDRTGFCLWMQRLEKHRFPWPANAREAHRRI